MRVSTRKSKLYVERPFVVLNAVSERYGAGGLRAFQIFDVCLLFDSSEAIIQIILDSCLHIEDIV